MVPEKWYASIQILLKLHHVQLFSYLVDHLFAFLEIPVSPLLTRFWGDRSKTTDTLPAAFSETSQSEHSSFVPCGCPSCHSTTFANTCPVHGPGFAERISTTSFPCIMKMISHVKDKEIEFTLIMGFMSPTSDKPSSSTRETNLLYFSMHLDAPSAAMFQIQVSMHKV